MVGHCADRGVRPDIFGRLNHVNNRVDRQDDTHEAERCAEGTHERESQEVAAHGDAGVADGSQDGDEAILDAAAYRSQLAGKPVRAANAYVFRYWLGGHFYYVSTNYCCDPVCVLHLPGKAKMRQLTVIYHKYTRSGRMPENQTVWRLCCLPAARPPLLRSLLVRLRAKIGI